MQHENHVNMDDILSYKIKPGDLFTYHGNGIEIDLPPGRDMTDINEVIQNGDIGIVMENEQEIIFLEALSRIKKIFDRTGQSVRLYGENEFDRFVIFPIDHPELRNKIKPKGENPSVQTGFQAVVDLKIPVGQIIYGSGWNTSSETVYLEVPKGEKLYISTAQTPARELQDTGITLKFQGKSYPHNFEVLGRLIGSKSIQQITN
jgi:hypothetical protein